MLGLAHFASKPLFSTIVLELWPVGKVAQYMTQVWMIKKIDSHAQLHTSRLEAKTKHRQTC